VNFSALVYLATHPRTQNYYYDHSQANPTLSNISESLAEIMRMMVEERKAREEEAKKAMKK
jgi:hypothetical protein